MSGVYCTSPGFVGHCFTFSNDSAFKYYGWTCLTQSEGIGHYKIKGKELSLTFTNYDSINKTVLTEKDTICHFKDSTEFYFTISDIDNISLMMDALISYYDKSKKTFSAVTDNNGNCSLKIPKTSDTIQIHFQYIGFKQYVITFPTNKCLHVYLKMEHATTNFIKKNETWTYTVVKNNRHKLILKDTDNYTLIYRKKR